MSELTLKNDLVGVIAYKLTVDGEVIEIITPEEAIEYLHGADNVIPGLEDALEGKKAGDSFAVTVSPEMGYGEYDEEEVDTIALEDFDMDISEIEVGEELELWNDEEGILFEAIVTEITDSDITLDFNHPLAGKTLHYEVQVIEVRTATEEELDMGMPQSLAEEMVMALGDEGDEDDEFYELNHKH